MTTAQKIITYISSILDRDEEEDKPPLNPYQIFLKWCKSIPYKEYLKTDHWKYFRKRALINARYTCQLCNAQNVSFEVHHRHYKTLGRETFDDVTVLCNVCHKHHSRR